MQPLHLGLPVAGRSDLLGVLVDMLVPWFVEETEVLRVLEDVARVRSNMVTSLDMTGAIGIDSLILSSGNERSDTVALTGHEH